MAILRPQLCARACMHAWLGGAGSHAGVGPAVHSSGGSFLGRLHCHAHSLHGEGRGCNTLHRLHAVERFAL